MVDLKTIKEFDPELYDSFVKEFDRQQYNLELIASENIVSPAVMAAMGTFSRISTPRDIPETVITAVANSWISPKISRATG